MVIKQPGGVSQPPLGGKHSRRHLYHPHALAHALLREPAERIAG